MILTEVMERLRKLVYPDAEEIIMQPGWMQAFADMRGRYGGYQYYYSGDVLRQLADPKRPEDSELKYPLKINLCREWADMLASYVWGQWNENIVGFTVRRKLQESGDVAEVEEKRCKSMENVLLDQWKLSGNNAHGDGAATDMMVYGGTVIKTRWDNKAREVADDWMSPDIFMPRWHPTNVNQLLEAILAYVISRVDARDIYNLTDTQYKSLPEEVLVWERWTDKEFQLHVEDIKLRDNPKNPYGWIPFTYIPRRRSKADLYGYFGLSTLEDTMALQNEVNARTADIGDGVAYASHPIRVVVNYTGAEDLEVGPDALWNLGFGFGGREPKATSLDTKTNYKEAMDFVKDVEHMGRGVAHLPSIAFGEDEGSQRSGTTLLIRFLPLTQEIRRTRLYLEDGLRRRAMAALRLAARNGVDGVQYEEDDLGGRVVNVNFAPILPKDVSEKVEEWSVRISGGFGTPEEAYEDLGHPRPQEAAEKALEYQETVARQENLTKGVQNVAGKTTTSRPTATRSSKSDDGSASADKKRSGGAR